MPLLRTPGEPDHDEARSMLGFWMREAGAFGPVEGVRVFVTLDALWTLGRVEDRDLASARTVFDQHRDRIELAAGRRYDNPTGRSEEDERHEGKPVVVIATFDLAAIPRESRADDPSRFA